MDIDPFWPDASIIILSEENDKGTLFLGNIKAAQEEKLKSRLIKAVVTVAIDAQQIYKDPDIKQVKFNVQDDEAEDLRIHFEQCFEFIEENLQRTNVLVHCLAGVSRSVTITVAYLMRKMNLSFQEAFKFVKIRRSAAWPNEGFIKQLKEYEQFLNNKKI